MNVVVESCSTLLKLIKSSTTETIVNSDCVTKMFTRYAVNILANLNRIIDLGMITEKENLSLINDNHVIEYCVQANLVVTGDLLCMQSLSTGLKYQLFLWLYDFMVPHEINNYSGQQDSHIQSMLVLFL